MITQEQMREVALFFLFTFRDESLALQAAAKAVAQLKTPSTYANKNSNGEGLISRSMILDVLRRIWQVELDRLARSKTQLKSGLAKSAVVDDGRWWVLPGGVDLDSWVSFRKVAADEEVAMVTLSKILQFSDEQIARSWDVSTGTVRYRVGRGMRQLGTVRAGALR